MSQSAEAELRSMHAHLLLHAFQNISIDYLLLLLADPTPQVRYDRLSGLARFEALQEAHGGAPLQRNSFRHVFVVFWDQLVPKMLRYIRLP